MGDERGKSHYRYSMLDARYSIEKWEKIHFGCQMSETDYRGEKKRGRRDKGRETKW